MTINCGVIYRDNLEPEHADLRRSFEDALCADVVVVHDGVAWKINKVEVSMADRSFVVEGSRKV